MKRKIGTVSMGIRCPIIRKGDDLAEIVRRSVAEAAESGGFALRDGDVVAVTESALARSQGNYASVGAIAKDVKAKLGGGTVGVVFPILSRNRFSVCLRGIAAGAKKIVLMPSYPDDEVGNSLISLDKLDGSGVNPYRDVLTLKKYRELFGENKHSITGVDYVGYYEEIIREAGAEPEIIFANDARSILNYADRALACDIHTRARTKRILREAGAEIVLGLDDILVSSIDGEGFNEDFGLLGSNKATENTVKLFPRKCAEFVERTRKLLNESSGKKIEVMIYGDGAFRDPKSKIWELADPCVSPAFTPGLAGTPGELKLKYLADDEFKDLSGEKLEAAISKRIAGKGRDLKGKAASQGTTPRQISDLLGSLCDLTSGSGDKGTPVVLVQGYFDNFAD